MEGACVCVSVWEAPRRHPPPPPPPPYQVPSLFKPSGPHPGPSPVPPGPSSYAEYVVQQSVPTASPGTTEPVPVPVSTAGVPPRPPQPPEPGGGGPPRGAVPGGGGSSAGDVPPLPVLKPGAKSSSIIVSPRQVRGGGGQRRGGPGAIPVYGGGPSPGVIPQYFGDQRDHALVFWGSGGTVP